MILEILVRFYFITTVTLLLEVFFLGGEPCDNKFISNKNLEMNVNRKAFPRITVIVFKNMNIFKKPIMTLPPSIMFIEVFFIFFFFFPLPMQTHFLYSIYVMCVQKNIFIDKKNLRSYLLQDSPRSSDHLLSRSTHLSTRFRLSRDRPNMSDTIDHTRRRITICRQSRINIRVS